MEIHMGEDAMTTAEFEAAFMDEAATAKIRLTKTTDDRCRLVTLSPGDAFAACVAQGGDAAGQRAQRDGRQAGAYAQRTEASGTAPGV